MDLRQLESFLEIAKQKSFTKAAETLYLTQPTLTGHIQALESELDTVLFDRRGKEISLTEAGLILYNQAVNILNMKEQIYYSMYQYKGSMEGELAIAASTVPQRCLLPSLLKAFSSKYPAITYKIKHFDSHDVIGEIISGSMDFGFVGTGSSYTELEMYRLCSDSLMLITPNEGRYAEMKKNTLTWQDIKEERLIFREKGSATKKLFLAELGKLGIDLKELNVIANIEDTSTIKQCVRAGLGLAVVSELMVQEELSLGLLKGFYLTDFDLVRDFYFINHKNRVLNPVARVFKEFTCEYFPQIKNTLNG